jgi:hypothetical protein
LYEIQTKSKNHMRGGDWSSIKCFSDHKEVACTKRRWFGFGSEYESTKFVEMTDEEKDECWKEMVGIARSQPDDVSVRIIHTIFVGAEDMYKVVWRG